MTHDEIVVALHLLVEHALDQFDQGQAVDVEAEVRALADRLAS